MIETSDFITLDSEKIFERIDPLESAGSTSLAYLVNRDGEQYFMKQLRPEYKDNSRYSLVFRKEFAVGQSLDHPNIVRYKEMGENDGGLYILTEYVSGETLEERLTNNPEYFRSNGNLDRFFVQLLDALEYLHNHHIVYSDLKPDNIMLTRINNDVKIIDLGFCETDEFAFTAGMTESFSAPEQHGAARSELDVLTDIYAIGKLMEYIEKKRGRTLPSSYHRMMKRCLNKKKQGRYGRAGEIRDAIKHRKLNFCIRIGILLPLLPPWQQDGI